MGLDQPSILIREMYVVCHSPDLLLMPFEQTAFEKSLFRTGGGGAVEFGAKQCMYAIRSTRTSQIDCAQVFLCATMPRRKNYKQDWAKVLSCQTLSIPHVKHQIKLSNQDPVR